jgi:hypothetical protein
MRFSLAPVNLLRCLSPRQRPSFFRQMIMVLSQEKRLEAYTLKRPQEVLLATVETLGEPDQILIFKGFSSSLMRPTNFDAEVPILSQNAIIVEIDRLRTPYNPNQPDYLQKGMTWGEMEVLLEKMGI